MRIVTNPEGLNVYSNEHIKKFDSSWSRIIFIHNEFL